MSKTNHFDDLCNQILHKPKLLGEIPETNYLDRLNNYYDILFAIALFHDLLEMNTNEK